MTISLLSEKDYEKVKNRLQQISYPVKLLFFSNHNECEHCKITRNFLHTLLELANSNLDVEFYDILTDAEKAAEHKVEHTPTILVFGSEQYGIRFTGVPGGFEMISFLHALELVGKKQCSLSDETLKKISIISKPIDIKIFITPSCPYCPTTVSLAHELAFVNKNISADMVESTEFPEYTKKFGVQAVPHITVNNIKSFEGNLPEALFVEQIVDAYNQLYKY